MICYNKNIIIFVLFNNASIALLLKTSLAEWQPKRTFNESNLLALGSLVRGFFLGEVLLPVFSLIIKSNFDFKKITCVCSFGKWKTQQRVRFTTGQARINQTIFHPFSLMGKLIAGTLSLRLLRNKVLNISNNSLTPIAC